MQQWSNDLIIRTLKGEKVERPPIWLMRQAGRILPQYRAIRNNLDGFKSLLKNPQLAAEVTVQPVDELDVDAAILFSDILVIPESMGFDYDLIEKKGPIFRNTLDLSELENMKWGSTCLNDLHYVFNGIDETIARLDGRVPLLGFSGSPWTLFAYMIEGQGSKTFSKAKAALYRYPDESKIVLDRITQTIIAYLKEKVRRGVAAVQLFDSWATVLNRALYQEFAIPYLQRISQSLIEDVPVILFSKGAYYAIEDLNNISGPAIGLDWTMNIESVRSVVGNKRVLQGNLDPCCLYANSSYITLKAREVIQAFGKNHIFNLGHGVYPDTPLENVKTLVDFVKSYRYSD